MEVITKQIDFKSKGKCHIVNLTHDVADMLSEIGLKNGTVTVFAYGSTAAVTTVEYEPGLVSDLNDLFEKIAPSNQEYAHDATWGDANGYSHVRASLLGPSLTVPFSQGELILGTWQQIIALDFDNRPRNRTIVLQFMGKK